MNKKGNLTKCITIRLEEDVIKLLTEKANKVGLETAGQYIKTQIVNKYQWETGSEPVNKPSKEPPQVVTEWMKNDKPSEKYAVIKEDKILERKPPQPKWLK